MGFTGEFSALGAALMWSSSSYIFTDASIRLGAIQLNIFRMIIACILLGITIPIANIDYLLNADQFFFLAISGLVGLVLGDSFLFKSFKIVGPRISMLVMSTSPAIAALLAYFILGETLSAWAILGIAITLTGVSMVILEKNTDEKSRFRITKAGVFYAFLGAAGQAGGLILARMANDIGMINGITASLVRLLAASIVLLPIGIIAGKVKNPRKTFANDRKALGLLLIGSLIGPYLGITLSFIAIIYTKVGIASTLMSTMPIIMLPISYFTYKEKLGWKSIVGAFVAVAGVSILFLK